MNRWRSWSKNERERKKRWLEKCQTFCIHVFVCLTLKYFHSLYWLWSQCVMMTAELSAPLVKHWSYCISWLASLIRNNYTRTKKTRVGIKIKQDQTENTPHEAVSLPGCPPSCGKVLIPHFPHWCVPYYQCSKWNPNRGSTDITWSRTWCNGIWSLWLSLCVCRYWPPPNPNSSEAKGNAAGCRRRFPPWTTWSSCIYVPPWQQDSQFYLHHQLPLLFQKRKIWE